jgi:hypothetical protein
LRQLGRCRETRLEDEKSIIAFAEDTKINRKGMFAIYRAIARAFGKDKLTDNDKVKWFMENKETLNPAEAKEPHIARALLISLDRAKKENKTNIMVELDATNSQKEIVAVLTKCKTTAMTCNIYNPSNSYIQDAYAMVADEMTRLINEALTKQK